MVYTLSCINSSQGLKAAKMKRKARKMTKQSSTSVSKKVCPRCYNPGIVISYNLQEQVKFLDNVEKTKYFGKKMNLEVWSAKDTKKCLAKWRDEVSLRN